MDPKKCHIGMMTEDQADLVSKVCREYRERRGERFN
jgi:hypothetical protein